MSEREPQGGAVAEVGRLHAKIAELRGKLEQFRSLADRSTNLIFLLDLETGRLVFANERFEDLLGYSPAELTAPGFAFFTLIAPDSEEKVRRSHEFHLRGEEHLPFEFSMLARDGRSVEVMLDSWIIDYAGHRTVVGVITDITALHRLAGELRGAVERAERGAEALRRAKEDLERQNVELRALDRMKDGLVRDVSHELKTPVAKQAMQLEILKLQLGGAGTGPVAKTLAVMEETVHRQQRVIRNLLDLARLDAGRRVFCHGPVRVDEVLARAVEDYRQALEASGFALQQRVEPITVSADAEMLWHVLSNLVNNALKFAGREGQRRLEIAAFREGDRAVVRIADNGIGLSAEELERVFERFYQASGSIEGSGVGLSICRSIMEGMGGTVTLESPGPGRGAVATVILPL